MRILITGASKGIGRGIGAAARGAGVSLALCGTRPSAELTSIAAECVGQGRAVLPR